MIAYNILPIGFSSYEKSTIETFFRLAGRRAPHWGLTARSSEARVVLFNATSQQDIESFRSLVASWQKVILVGSSDFGTGWPVLPRPIKLTAILGLLDVLVDVDVTTQKAPAAADIPVLPAAVPAKPRMTDVFANVTSKVESTAAPVVVRDPATTASLMVPVSKQESEARTATNSISNVEQIISSKIVARSATSDTSDIIGRVLIVDDSDIALKYMQNRLRHFGYECELVHSGEEALAMVGKCSYHFVFLDVMMAGLDGYQTCKAIKNNKARRGPAPVVVMLTSRGGTIDKIRGSMAGCDAYLTKPLNDNRLGAVLAKFDQTTITQRWEAANPRQPLVDSYAPQSR